MQHGSIMIQEAQSNTDLTEHRNPLKMATQNQNSLLNTDAVPKTKTKLKPK